MRTSSRLFLYSMQASESQWQVLDQMTGKSRSDIRIATVLHAMDVVPGGKDWARGFVTDLNRKGYQVRNLDLTVYKDRKISPESLDDVDVLWMCGGHTFYLRWILAQSGLDACIRTFVSRGGVYAGWSAGAIVAGPTLRHFEKMGDDPKQAPVVYTDGLSLTDKVIVPHIDHPMFRQGAIRAAEQLLAEGYKVLPLKDNEIFIGEMI